MRSVVLDMTEKSEIGRIFEIWSLSTITRSQRWTCQSGMICQPIQLCDQLLSVNTVKLNYYD